MRKERGGIGAAYNLSECRRYQWRAPLGTPPPSLCIFHMTWCLFLPVASPFRDTSSNLVYFLFDLVYFLMTWYIFCVFSFFCRIRSFFSVGEPAVSSCDLFLFCAQSGNDDDWIGKVENQGASMRWKDVAVPNMCSVAIMMVMMLKRPKPGRAH